jgi:hypothetical protein
MAKEKVHLRGIVRRVPRNAGELSTWPSTLIAFYEIIKLGEYRQNLDALKARERKNQEHLKVPRQLKKSREKQPVDCLPKKF